MSVYKKVQFIAWEIYTGPVYGKIVDPSYPLGYVIDAIDYAGIKSNIGDHRKDAISQCIDIDARVAFTKDAIEKAFPQADPSPDVLKIFMAPEFLYRGSGGAYIYDLINGWAGGTKPSSIDLPPGYSNWIGLFGKLKEIVADLKYKNWLFIFGTAVGGFFPGDNDDITDPGIILNSALIQLGGPKNEDETTDKSKSKCRVSTKYHMAGKDFIEFKINNKVYNNKTAIPLNPSSLISKDVLGVFDVDGGPLFSFYDIEKEPRKKIEFGIEVCLDHFCWYPEKQPDGSLQNIKEGMLKYCKQQVDIQLIPSCGMTLKPKSISLYQGQQGIDPNVHSYAFNCDGLLAPVTFSENEYCKWGSHVQVWDGASPRNEDNVSYDFESVDSSLIEVISDVVITVYNKDNSNNPRKINANELWNSSHYPPKGSGYIKVIAPKPL